MGEPGKRGSGRAGAVAGAFQHMERFEEIRCLVRGEVLSWLAERYP